MAYRWDARTLRFRDASGRFIKREAITRALESGIEETKNRILMVSGQLQRGEINLASWSIQMRDAIKAQHLLSAGIAQGGKAQLSPAALGRIGALTKVQYEKLAAFGREIERGYPIQSGRFLNRVQMYAKAGWGTFDETKRRLGEFAGHDVEENILNAKESCEDCQGETNKGKVPTGTLKRVGTRKCLTNCKCEILTSKAA